MSMTESQGYLERQQAPQLPERYSVSQVVEQVKTIQEIMTAVMKDGTHYGTIPGTDKPTLFKPGAEKLSLTFRMAPRYSGEDNPKDLGRGHREYIILCELYHIGTGRFLGAGVGSCSTMESRYRYRDTFEATGKPVPKEYWDKRNQALIGGSGFRAKKIDGQWQIVKITERQENPDIADQYNTVLKMAKKRAHVDASLTATAASDIFTQDLEDLVEETDATKPETTLTIGTTMSGSPPPKTQGPPKPPKQQPVVTDDWRPNFRARFIDLVGTEERAIKILGQHGYERWDQVATYEVAMKIYKDTEGGK